MKITFNLEQFPKNKIIPISLLSKDQIKIRNNSIDYFLNKSTKVCNKCGKRQAIDEFYVKNRGKHDERPDKTCRDCRLRAMNVIEIGKFRFAKKILQKGFRRCSVCKEIKPLSEFKKSKGRYHGYSNNCYECSNKLHSEYIIKQRKEIGDYYVKQYGIKRGVKEFNDCIMLELRNEIINIRNRFTVDGKNFESNIEFAEYMLKVYRIPITSTLSRLQHGKTEEECKIKEYEIRSIAHTKGKVKVIDTKTGNVFWFKNTRDKELLKMFSTSTIARCIKTGEETRITSLSKYKNKCRIERLK